MADRPSRLDPEALQEAMTSRPDWQVDATGTVLQRTFTFSNFHETMAFVNAVAWVAHALDHHPDLQVSYRTWSIAYTTHSEGGLTSLDLQSVDRINALGTL